MLVYTYRQFKVYENYCQSHDKKESTAHTHVHVYTCTCIYIFVYTQYQSLYVGSGQIQYTNSGKKMAQQHTMFITPLIIIVPKLTAWHCHIVHSVLTDIVHPESLRMKCTHWACALSTHAH